MSQPSFRDVEQLNAYLDGELDATRRQRLESRLGTDPELKSILDELREADGSPPAAAAARAS
jgi:anti-sigma factor RsiW